MLIKLVNNEKLSKKLMLEKPLIGNVTQEINLSPDNHKRKWMG